MVGAAPVCPSERPRSGVSIRKGHILPAKEAFPSVKGTSPFAKEAFPSAKGASPPAKAAFPFINNVCSHQNMFVHCADGCALVGRRGRAHRHRPYQPPSNPSTTQPSSFLSVGRASSGNHFSCCPSAEPLPATFFCFCPSAEPLPATFSCFSPSAEPLPATFSCFSPSAEPLPATFS